MQVTVKQFNRTNNGRVHALCSTNYGDITGIWQGEEPGKNQSYYVDFDVPQKLIWGVDIIETDYNEYRTWIEGDTTFLIVKKESYDEFKSLMFRIGDHFMQAEAEGESILGEEFYRIRLIGLLIYSKDC